MNNKSVNHMRHLQKLVLFAGMLACYMGWSNGAFAACGYPTGPGCSCEAMYYLDNAHNIHTGWKQLDTVKMPLMEDKCVTNAKRKCRFADEKLYQYAPIGSANSNAICNNGGMGVDYDTKLDNGKGRSGNCYLDVICHKSPVVCTCPQGWSSNTNQQVGGVTTDGKCKKVACTPNTISPYPAPNGTPIGSWGFSWDNGFVAWGTVANGGAPHCTGGEWDGYIFVIN
jgi:hypothetical protein